MSIAYGLYKNTRDAAYKVLIDNDVAALPVDVIKIATANGIRVLKNSDAKQLRAGEDGLGIYDGADWFVIYDDTVVNAGQRKFIVAHELGHIFLGHPLVAGYHRRSLEEPIPCTENEANLFAFSLISPSCVLWGLNLHTAEKIADVCKLSREAAQIRADRMAVLYERQRFLSSQLERQVYEQFKGYIEANKKSPSSP